MILVTGATGHVGGALVAALAGRVAVRAMTRRPAEARFPDGVRVCYGDAGDPDSLTEALSGVERAFLMSAQSPGSADGPSHDRALVRAAQNAGVDHLVHLSAYSTDDPRKRGEPVDTLGAWHAAAEDAVVGSGLAWTLLRPGRFMSNALAWCAALRRGDDVSVPYPGRPAAPIDPADIAAVAALALTTDEHHARAYPLSGPQVLTPADELGVLGRVLGRPLRAVEPPAGTLRAGLERGGMPAPMVEAVLARTATGTDGAEVVPTVSELLGRPPVGFADWAHAHAHLFREDA